MPVHRLLIKTANGTRSPGAAQPEGFLRAGPAHPFGSPHGDLSSRSLRSGQVEIEERAFSGQSTNRAEGVKKGKPAQPRRAWACLLLGLLPQSIPLGRLEPQVFSQEHGQDAVQVVYRGWVQVGPESPDVCQTERGRVWR